MSIVSSKDFEETVCVAQATQIDSIASLWEAGWIYKFTDLAEDRWINDFIWNSNSRTLVSERTAGSPNLEIWPGALESLSFVSKTRKTKRNQTMSSQRGWKPLRKPQKSKKTIPQSNYGRRAQPPRLFHYRGNIGFSGWDITKYNEKPMKINGFWYVSAEKTKIPAIMKWTRRLGSHPVVALRYGFFSFFFCFLNGFA